MNPTFALTASRSGSSCCARVISRTASSWRPVHISDSAYHRWAVAELGFSFTRFLAHVVALAQTTFLLRRRRPSNRVGGRACERARQEQGVTRRSFVPGRPEVLRGTGLDYWRGDTQAFGGTRHRASG